MPSERGDKDKRISAIVCTYNRYDVLPDALASLGKQSLPRSDYEVIVIDNSTDTDAQRAFWKKAVKRFAVTLYVQKEPGLSKARNAGLQLATTPLVAFIDDDAIASPNWLESLISLFDAEPAAGAAGGPVSPIWPSKPPAWLHPWLSGFFTIVDHGSERRELKEEEWLAGTNMAFRRAALIHAGGFDQNLGRRADRLLSNEELEVMQRIRETGLKIFSEPNALVSHKVHVDRVSQWWLRRRVAWQVISNALRPTANDYNYDPQQCWDTIARYALRVPPEMRTLRGLFMDTNDPATLQRQCDAISALMILMMHDGRDPEALG